MRGHLSNYMLNKKAIDEFKQIYLKEVGILLSDEDAAKKANDLISLFKILVQSSNFVRSDGLIKKRK